MWNNVSVVVTGGSGLVGINLVNRLREIGCKVRSIFHSKSPTIIHDDVEYIQSDLLLSENCTKIVKDMDYAFHTAASTSGAAAISSTPMIHVTPNVVINSYFFEACYQQGVKKVLWLSSTTGYPDSSKEVIEEEMFNDDPYDKYYYVGWMKRFTEVLCNMYSKLPKNMPIVVLRPSNIFGPYDKFDPQKSHVLPALIRKVVERQTPIEVWGDGDDERDLIYIDDMVDSIIVAMERINTYNPINIGYGRTYTVREVLKKILDIDRYSDANVIFCPDKPTMIPIRRVSIKKAKELLEFMPKVSLEEGIKKTIDFYRSTLK